MGREIPVIELTPIEINIKNNDYTRVVSIVYDTDFNGPLHRVKVLSYMDSGTTSYDVEVFDKTNETSLITANFTNTGDINESDLGLISSPPEGKVIIEINLKRTGIGYAHINQIVLYTRKEST